MIAIIYVAVWGMFIASVFKEHFFPARVRRKSIDAARPTDVQASYSPRRDVL